MIPFLYTSTHFISSEIHFKWIHNFERRQTNKSTGTPNKNIFTKKDPSTFIKKYSSSCTIYIIFVQLLVSEDLNLLFPLTRKIAWLRTFFLQLG